MILGVLLLGILYIFRQVLMLNPEVDWLERLRHESSGGLVYPGTMSETTPPRLLGPMAKMMSERKGRMSLSTLSMRTVLDSIFSRINESHEISRYLIGLLIFLGLLGTFWGLLETVNAVGDAISDLRVTSNEAAAMFQELKSGLAKPLDGMGTAFSSSLFGLAGSLVLGFLELQAGQAHNRFMNDLEEWLSSVTKLSSGGIGDGGDHSVPAYIQALLEQTADSLENLQRTIEQGETDRHTANRNLTQLTERLNTLTEQMRTEQDVLRRLAETQQQMRPLLERAVSEEASGIDQATREHIRNLDYRLERLVEEAGSGREHMVKEMRNEFRLLARTIAALAEESDQS